MHDAVNSYITRARLMAANGTSGNQVIHTYGPGIFMDRVQPANLDEMEQWLAAIANDKAPARSALEKVIRNRPAAVTDACYAKDGPKITDAQRCAQMFPVYSNPRLNAGLPMGSTMLKCELKAIDKADYRASLTAAQLAALKETFPSGVCDYTEEGGCGPGVRYLAIVRRLEPACPSIELLLIPLFHLAGVVLHGDARGLDLIEQHLRHRCQGIGRRPLRVRP